MNCTSEYKEKLGKYVRGDLPKKEADLVKEHLNGCSECLFTVEQLRAVYPGLQELSEEHIPTESLTEYFHESKTNPSQKEEIEEHLKICDDCQSELETLLALDKELENVKEPYWQIVKGAVKKFALKFSNFFTFPKLRYAVPVAAIILLFFIVPKIFQPDVPIPEPPLPSLAWERVDLVSSYAFRHDVSRGKNESILELSAKEAAIEEFTRSIKLVEGEVQFLTGEEMMQSPESKRILWVSLKDGSGNPLKEFTSAIPQIELPPSHTFASVQAWLIAFPSRELYSGKMTSDSLQTTWDTAKGDRVCITYKYRVGEKYRATPALFADLTALDKDK